jgi:hypothetical protein
MPLRRFVPIDIESLLLSTATITIEEQQRLEWARTHVMTALAFIFLAVDRIAPQ